MASIVETTSTESEDEVVVVQHQQQQQQYDDVMMMMMMKRGEVKCSSHRICSPVVVFAHGSSAPSSSNWIIRWRKLLATALNAVEVVTFDYPYIHGRRRAPPKPETLVGYHLDIVRKVVAKYPEHPLILAGKSLGSRVSCMVAAEKDIEASAVVCLGYPLKASKGGILDGPLLQLTVPIMFVQGGNDAFCPLKTLEVVMSKLKALSSLHVIEYGDHSFQIAKRSLELTGMTHEKAEECAAKAVADFVSQITNGMVISGSRDTTGLSIRACPKGILPQHVSRGDALAAAVEKNSQRIESQSKMRKISSIKQKPTQNERKRKSERILKNKLKKCVYVKDGRGSTVDNPLSID